MGTKIEWAHETWNPVVGCSKVSEGCRFCYAEAIALKYNWSRLPWTGPNAAENVILKESRLDEPRSRRKPTVYFVNSMSDLFHERVQDGFIDRIWEVMKTTRQHYYLILTKRPGRMQEYAMKRDVLANVGLGVSVENQMWAKNRLPALIATPAAMRFVSVEPLLGPVDLDPWIRNLQWIIAGGESGPKARTCETDWLRQVRDTCVEAGVPFFLKQLGGYPDKRGDDKAVLDGQLWRELPSPLRKFWEEEEKPVQGRLF